MNQSVECPRCGRSRPAATGSILGDGCPYCLLQFALGNEDASFPSEDASTESLPERIGPYRVLERLGSGGMGSVYRAEHATLGRIVALKVLHPEFARRPGFPERFQHEGRVLAGLQHPHILGIHDVGCDGGFYYLATEYVAGSTLRAKIDAGSLPVDEAIAIGSQICEALQYAHACGVIHRDVKPENVLLDAAGRVKVADFGIAKLVDAERVEHSPVTEAGVVVGTRRYMAPEQLEPGRSVDHRADLYSLGSVLYEMLTGELPLGVFAPPSGKRPLDPRLDAAILSALAKNPADRPANAAEFRRRLEATARPMPNYNRRWAIGIGGAAVLGAIAAALVRRNPSQSAAGHDELAKLGAIRLPHPAQVWGVAFAPQQKTLATSCEDGLLRLWNVGEWQRPASSYVAYPRSEFGYLALAFSPDGKSLVTAGGENVARLWDAATGKEIAVLRGHTREIVAVAFSPDGKQIATAGHDRTVRLWNAGDGAAIGTFGPVEDPTLCVSFSPDGSHLAAGMMNGGLRIWDIATQALRPTGGHVRRVWSLTYAPKPSGLLASVGHDRMLKLWNDTKISPIREISLGGEAWSVAVSPSGDLAATGLDDGTLRLWSFPDGRPLASVKQHASAVVSASFSHDGTLLASGSLDRSAIVWNVAMLLASPVV